MEAQIIRFPIERCRRRSSVGIAEIVYAPLLFGMTLTNMFVAFVTCGWLPASSRGIDDAPLAGASRPNV